MKRVMIVFMSVALAASVFANGASSGSGGYTKNAKGTLPLVTGDVTFSLFTSGINAQVTSFDYNDNSFTKKIVDETGVKLDITAVGGADASQRFNVMMSSGNYPELILNTGLGTSDLAYYGAQGIYIPLDQYDLMSYPNIKAAFDKYPALFERLRGPDGKIYGLPAVNDCLHCTYSQGRAWYYMPWIRDNNRKVPETLDEFTAYLRWVRDNDVNKNGDRNDEIPLAFSSGDFGQGVSYVAHAFMPWVDNGVALNNKKVWLQYKDREFRQALAVLNGWYKEGLIAENSFTMSGDQRLNLVHNAAPIVGATFGAWSPGRQPSERWIEYFHLLPLVGPTGLRHASNGSPWDIVSAGMAITDKCKDPALAIAWYDYMLGFEIMLDGIIGPKGEAWTDADQGGLGLNGEPALYKLLVNFGGQRVNAGWNQANPNVRSDKFRLGEQAIDVEIAQRWWQTGDPTLRDRLLANSSYNEETNFYFANQDVPWTIPANYFVPPYAPSDTDNARLADIEAVLGPYLNTAWVEFVTGVRDISSDTVWNAYLTELDRLGASEKAAIIQKYVK